MKKENIAIIEMLICAALWSVAGIFIKLIPWNGFAVAGMRSLIAGLTIAVYMLITCRRYILSRRTVIGGIMTAGVYTCFWSATWRGTSASARSQTVNSSHFLSACRLSLPQSRNSLLRRRPAYLYSACSSSVFPTYSMSSPHSIARRSRAAFWARLSRCSIRCGCSYLTGSVPACGR